MQQPTVNITMPVFNRYAMTQRTITALRQSSDTIPFTFTVVDNGSDAALVAKLKEFHGTGLINKLFLLPRNMGIPCACNIGWIMTDAPFYLKIDNDMLVQDPDWLVKLFTLWSHGERLSTFGPAWSKEQQLASEGALETPDGTLGICMKNLPGAVIFVPKAVSDILGRWNEDYGLYGAEDGDYGARMKSVGFPQYYYLAHELVQDLGRDEKPEDRDYVLDRGTEHKSLFFDEKGGTGLFKLNNYLFTYHIRNPKVPLRYTVADVDENCKVRLKEDKAYAPVREALELCKIQMDRARASKDPDKIFRDEFQEGLRGILRERGQAWD